MKIYIIDDPEYRDSLSEYLEGHGEVVFLHKDTKSITDYGEILEDPDEKIIAVAPRLIDWELPINFISKVPSLVGIATKSSWAHYIDLKFCAENNIQVENSPGANAQAVAEYAIWQMFSLMRNLKLQIENEFKVSIEKDTEGTEAQEKTVGILGLGRIGSAIARMTEGLGMKVIYWNRNKRDVSYEYTEIDDLLKRADVVFKCWETCDETRDLLNKENLQQLKSGSFFISVFGGIGWSGEDDYILIDMVEQGRIGGFSVENDHHKNAKLKDYYEGNIFIPTAFAWHTKETQAKYNSILADAIINIINNHK